MQQNVLKVVLILIMAVISFLGGILPIKVFAWMSDPHGAAKRAQCGFSLLACFAGGVFFAVCLLDLLPDALDNYDEFVHRADFAWASYPWVPLLIGVGMFAVHLTEIMSHKLCGGAHAHDDEKEEVRPSKIAPTATRETMISMDSISVENSYRASMSSVTTGGTRKSLDAESAHQEALRPGKIDRVELVRCLSLVFALTVHSTLEGFAFGVQDTDFSVYSLFFGIMCHKALVFFSVGMRLLTSIGQRPRLVVGIIAFLTLTAPAGCGIGMLVQDSDMGRTEKDAAQTILISLSMGAFLYITFFEMLGVEFSKKRVPAILQWLATVLGFTVIAIFMAFGG